MEKKGFTLVELLAVIVVLGIIALIGYSAVGNVIEVAQMKADKLSIANYAKALEQKVMEDRLLGDNKSITDENGNITFVDGVIQSVTVVPATNPSDGYWESHQVFYTDYDGSTVTCTGGKFVDGNVELYNCKVNNGNNIYDYSNNNVTLIQPVSS